MSDESDIPIHWSMATVGDIATSIQYGHTASAVDRESGPRFLRITDIQNGQVNWKDVPGCEIDGKDIAKYRLHDGDLVFARTGATTGKSYLIRDCPEAIFASYLIRVRTVTELDSRYLSYFFQTSDYWRQVERGKRGIGQPNVNATTLSKVTLPIAPFNEQHRIVAKIEELFSDLDAGVAALERAKANLKRYRAAVLKAAVEGKLTEQWRADHPDTDTEPASQLLQRILTKRRQHWEEEQLAKYEANGKQPPKNWKGKYKEPADIHPSDYDFPDEWSAATMDTISSRDPNSICAGPFGTIFKARDFRPSGVPIIFLRHVREGYYSTKKPGFMDAQKWDELFRPYSVYGGELLVTKLGEPPGVCATYPGA